MVRVSIWVTLIYLHLIAATVSFQKSDVVIHDMVSPPPRINAHGVLSSSSPLPDWSDVIRPKSPHYVEILLAVDAAVSRHYGHDRDKIVSALTSLMHAVNLFTYQLNIRIIVVDVVAVRGNNLTLDQFLEWRQETPNLAPHDVAMLVRHRYEGGIAYVDGVCKRTAVGVCGFFPEAPFEYAPVFFHELAHLLGLSHDVRATCHCKDRKKTCLKIEGFEYDCSAQALVDLLPSVTCLGPPTAPLPRTAIPLCGNGVVEDDEDCDCGPEGFCDNVICAPRSCRFIFPKKYIYSTFTFTIALFIFVFFLLIKRICTATAHIATKSTAKERSHTPMLATTLKSVVVYPTPEPRVKSACTETEIFPQCAISLPTLVRKQESASKRSPIPLSLDHKVPLTSDGALSPGYVPMHPPKEEKKEELKLPCIHAPQRPEIGDPIPIIVAGQPVAEWSRTAQTLDRTLPKTNLSMSGKTPSLPKKPSLPPVKPHFYDPVP